MLTHRPRADLSRNAGQRRVNGGQPISCRTQASEARTLAIRSSFAFTFASCSAIVTCELDLAIVQAFAAGRIRR